MYRRDHQSVPHNGKRGAVHSLKYFIQKNTDTRTCNMPFSFVEQHFQNRLLLHSTRNLLAYPIVLFCLLLLTVKVKQINILPFIAFTFSTDTARHTLSLMIISFSLPLSLSGRKEQRKHSSPVDPFRADPFTHVVWPSIYQSPDVHLNGNRPVCLSGDYFFE